MLLVAQEKLFRSCARLGGVDAVNGAGIAGRNVEAAGCIEGQIPDVMRLAIGRIGALLFVAGLALRSLLRRLAGGGNSSASLAQIEDHRGAGFILLRGCVGLELVNLAAGQRRGVERAIRPEPDNLHAYIFCLEKREWLC